MSTQYNIFRDNDRTANTARLKARLIHGRIVMLPKGRLDVPRLATLLYIIALNNLMTVRMIRDSVMIHGINQPLMRFVRMKTARVPLHFQPRMWLRGWVLSAYELSSFPKDGMLRLMLKGGSCDLAVNRRQQKTLGLSVGRFWEIHMTFMNPKRCGTLIMEER